MDFAVLDPVMPPEVARQIINRQAAIFRADPALPQAIRTDVLGTLDLFDRDKPFDRTVNDMAVFVLGVVALALHYSVGLSHRSLRNWVGRGGLISAGRATAILWRLRHYNLVVPVGQPENGKRVNFVPQPSMVDIYRRRLAVFATAVGKLDPEVESFAPRLNEDAPFRALMIAMGRALVSAAENSDPTLTTMERLTYRTHGSMMLLCMVQTTYAAGAERPGGDFILSTAEIVHTLGVSPSHVRGFITELERVGFLERSGAGTKARLTPAFTEAFETYYSTFFAGVAEVVRAARTLLDISTMKSNKI
jgi:hypothetical protein